MTPWPSRRITDLTTGQERHNDQEGKAMGKITVGQQNSDSIEIYYEDHGTGQPVARSS
jgi:hypothetical protein